METPAQFEGWAIVELFGHQREIGYVTTRYFGTACLFQVDVPELPERESVTTTPQYVAGKWTPVGSKICKKKRHQRTRMLGPGSIYALNPCTEEAAKLAIEQLVGREIVLIEVPKESTKLIETGAPECRDQAQCCECEATSFEEHEPGCPNAI